MTRILLTLTILLSHSDLFSQVTKGENYTLTITKGGFIKEDDDNQTYFITLATFTNNTKDTLRYFSMSCSWQDFYSVDNNKLQFQGIDCDNNAPIILTLAPGQSRTVKLRLLVSNSMDSSNSNFKIGFNLMKASANQRAFSYDFKEGQKKKNIIWSNTISM
jgi:hypothetical protein